MKYKQLTVNEIASINTLHYSSKDKWGHIQYLDTGSVTHGIISELKQLNPNIEKVPSRARRKVKPGSIVYSMVRPNQEHYALLENPPENLLVSTGFCVIDAKTTIVDPKYLYYALTTSKATAGFQSLAEQRVSTYPTLSVADISSYEIKLPLLAEQKAVVKVLSTLDKKIELNNRINDYLVA